MLPTRTMFTYARAFCRLALTMSLTGAGLAVYPLWLDYRYFLHEETFVRSTALGLTGAAIILNLIAFMIGSAVFEAQKSRASHHFRPFARTVMTLSLALLPSAGVIGWLAYRVGV
ncbi:MAG: hypothetical protein ACHREM_31120 [Polyangiales bacterium]